MISAGVTVYPSTPIAEYATSSSSPYLNFHQKGYTGIKIKIVSLDEMYGTGLNATGDRIKTTAQLNNNTDETAEILDDRNFLIFDTGGRVWKVYNISKKFKVGTTISTCNEINQYYVRIAYFLYDKFTTSEQPSPSFDDKVLLCSPFKNGLIAPINVSDMSTYIFKSMLNFTAYNHDELFKPAAITNANLIPFSSTNFDSTISTVSQALDNLKTTTPSQSTATGLTTISKTAITPTYNTSPNTDKFNTVSAVKTNTPNSIVYRDSSGDFEANVITATSVRAQYADIAERYTCKDFISVGDVVSTSISNDYDIEVCKDELSHKVIGIVSENPGYIINSDCDGPTIARIGKIKAKVKGYAIKGEPLVSAGDGCLRQYKDENELMFKVAYANENKTILDVSLIEVIL